MSPSVQGADPEHARAVLRNLRTATDATLTAMLVAARQAEQAATAHREQVEALAVAIRAYDAALSQFTAPTTLHD